MFARKLYAQVFLHNGLIIFWCIMEKEFEWAYFKKLSARNIPDDELELKTMCFNSLDYPEIKSEDFTKQVTSKLAPEWINQWEYNTNYCFIKAKVSEDAEDSSHKNVLEYISYLQEKRRRKWYEL